jgi:hypothetical protein
MTGYHKLMSKRYKIIGRGLAGWHADAGTVETGGINGGGTYSTKESSSGGSLENYVSKAVKGCLVYDASEADADIFSNHVYTEPMVDVDLPAGNIRMALSKEAEAFVSGIKLRSIDYVSIDIFEKMLRRIPGMKFGKVMKGKVVWE